MHSPLVDPFRADACRATAQAAMRAAMRTVALAVLLLQLIAPWLHAHVRAAQTVGFHLHLPHAAGAQAAGRAAGADVAPGAGLRAIATADDGDAAVMPGGWLRGPATPDLGDSGDTADAGPAVAGLRMPPPPAALASRVAQLDAPRPPPLARRAQAPRAPPLAGIGTPAG